MVHSLFDKSEPNSRNNMDLELTEIQKFYKDTSIFLTGATGFLGILTVEKLLWSCPDISKIYILVRNKRGRNMEERIRKIFDSPVFTRLKKRDPDFESKVEGILGDCALPELGISEQERSLLINQVDIVFHVAATVSLDEKMKTAIQINLNGTKHMMKLAREMKKLKSLIYVSTAFCNSSMNPTEEKIYQPAYDYRQMSAIAENIPEEILEKIKPDLIGKYPNSYTITKQIAENVIYQFGKGLPVGIFRPTVVISTSCEPIPGWINNVYGPTGMVLGAGLGVIRLTNANPECKAHMVPADMVINFLIASAWDVADRVQRKPIEVEADVPVYNYDCPDDNMLTWGQFMHLALVIGSQYASNRAIWIYVHHLERNYILYLFWRFWMHTVPGYLMDFVLICMKKEPKLVSGYQKIHKFSQVISFFSTREWYFSNSNVEELLRKISDEDKKIFPCDMRLGYFDWNKFFVDYIKGIRIYLGNEPLDNLQEALRRYKKLYWAHQILKSVLLLFLFWLIWKIFSCIF